MLLPSVMVVLPAIVGAGVALIVTDAVVAVVLPQLFVAVSVYTPADAVLTVTGAGLSAVDEKLFGPLQV